MFCVAKQIPYIPAVGPTIGRNTSATLAGANSSFTIGFSGGAAASGTWLVMVVQSNVGEPTLSSTWTKLSGGLFGYQCYIRYCGGSETTTYTITYSGASKSDACSATMVEVIGANATNPDAQAVATNTGTCASAVSSTSVDCCVIAVSDVASGSTNFNTPPVGYTAQGRIQSTGSPINTVAIGTQVSVGSGTISPGTWGNPSTASAYLWTVLFKA